MGLFVIAMGAAQHMKLSRGGRDFSSVDAPMPFDSHDAAYDYLLRHNDEDPRKGVRAEILEDLSL